MTEREKLIELLKSGGVRDFPFNAALADHLLANGVIVPPCKVGDTLYMIVEKRAKITRDPFYLLKETKLTFLNLERVCKYYGTDYFLSREEAEKALAERSKG